MKLAEIFFGNKQVTDTGKVQTQSDQDSGYFGRQLHSLTPGQTIQGEVLSRNGSEVQIKVSDDMVLKAKVDQNINLEIGKTITFEVKNNGQTLTLSPLYTNTATDANVLKALDMAGLPVNSDTIYMTEQMMQAGLSIDRNSLLQIYKEISTFQGSNISDIVDLHRMSMPVTEENLTQISSYKNMTHQLVDGFNQVTDTLPDVVRSMIQGGDMEGAAKLYQEIINLISEANGNYGEGLGENNILQGPASTINTETIIIQDAGVQADTLQADGALANVQSNPQISGEVQLLLDMLAAGKGEHVAASGETGAASTEALAANAAQPQATMINSTEQQATTAMQGYAAGQLNDINALLSKLLQQGINTKDTALLQRLLGNKEIAAYIKDNLQKMWTIRPEDVAGKENVEELYQRLGKQLRTISQTLESVNQTGSETYRATTNLTQNIDFLQQMNQVYTYLQLPLRLQQGNNAHGDLYVYTNKKHLASKEGQITALLHLDMENLGPLDIYVAMQNERVNTKFYVQDEILDFLSEHMHILTERLNKRGYQCNCEMLTRERKAEAGTRESVIHRLLEKEPQLPLVQYSFDVRT